MTLPHPNVVDFIALGVVIAGTLRGLYRGLAKELSGTVSAILALYLAMTAFRSWGHGLASHTRLSAESANALVFTLTALAVIVVMFLLRMVLGRVMSLTVTNKTVERVGGLVAGMIKWTVLVIVLLLAMIMWRHPYLDRVCGRESMTGRMIVRQTPELREKAKEIPKLDFREPPGTVEEPPAHKRQRARPEMP